MKLNIDESTTARFGEQWVLFPENSDYYGSIDCLKDICSPLFNIDDFCGKNICDVGSGTGRVVNMLLDAGADFVTAIEPSKAYQMLELNTAHAQHKVHLIQAMADTLNEKNKFDYVVSFGVLHHIVDPNPTIKAIYQALKPGGKCIIWLYGFEGNRLYLSIFGPIRKITTRLSHHTLLKLSHFLTKFINFYIMLCKYLPLPMRNYIKNHLSRLTIPHRTLTIYDQLNPTYAKYYKKQEAYNLLNNNEFKNVQIHHRHGYSWTVVGEK